MTESEEPPKQNLPPSAKLVYRVLDEADGLTKTEICERTDLARTTTQYALDRLREEDIITSRTHLSDARLRVYDLDD